MAEVLLLEPIKQYLDAVSGELGWIPERRKEVLEQLAAYIRRRRLASEVVRLTVICTHNSRRSHMGQLWAKAAAAWHGLEEIHCFSGGTEATAFHPNAVAALRRAGFRISGEETGDNPAYQAHYSKGLPAVRAYSKRFDDAANPSRDFAAVMVCSEADEACPFVPGAALRLSLPFEDPKRSDGSPGEAAAYDEACRLIAREFFFMMARAAQAQ